MNKDTSGTLAVPAFLQVCDACKGAHKNILSLAQRANKNRTL